MRYFVLLILCAALGGCATVARDDLLAARPGFHPVPTIGEGGLASDPEFRRSIQSGG